MTDKIDIIVGSIIGVGVFSLPTSLATYGPVTLVSIGLFYISSGNYSPWNVAAAKVRNPHRNIPRATVLGTIATAVVYMLSLTVAFGIVPTPKLAPPPGMPPYPAEEGAGGG